MSRSENFVIKFFIDRVRCEIKNIHIQTNLENNISQRTSDKIDNTYIQLSHYIVSFYKIFPVLFYRFYNSYMDFDRKAIISTALLMLNSKYPSFRNDYAQIMSKITI